MSDKYRRVEKKREETPIASNEIRITALGKRKNYITYAINKLTNDTAPERAIVLKAMGRAMAKAVTVA